MNKQLKKIILIQVVIIFLVISAYLFINSKYVYKVPICYFYDKYDILCPACGGTRCVAAFLRGDIVQAFKMHAVFASTIVLIGIIDIVYIVCAILNKKIKLFKPYFLIIWIIVLLIYTIFRNII